MLITVTASVVLTALLAACERDLQTAAEAPAETVPPVYGCGRGGALKAEVFGAVVADIDWDAEALTCEGMPRPEGRGARLRFAGEVAGFEQGLSVIIALPDLQRGETARELTTNATLILEGEGRFFSTATEGACWTDVTRQEPLGGERFTVSGKMYCIAPLVEVNGNASVSISQLEFAGRLDWSAS